MRYVIAVALILVAVFAFAPAAGATEEPETEPCYVTIPATESEYTWTEEVQQWQFRTRAPLYGSKEVKEVYGYDFVDGGTVTIQGEIVAGHWVVSPGWHTIPDVIINIVWGEDGVPASVLGTGNVNLSFYGGPGVSVQYNAHEVETDAGFTDWGPWSDWTSSNPGAGTDLMNVGTRTVPGAVHTDWFLTDPGTPWAPTGNTRDHESETVQSPVPCDEPERTQKDICVNGDILTVYYEDGVEVSREITGQDKCLAETGAPDNGGLAATAGSLVALGTVALLARRRLA